MGDMPSSPSQKTLEKHAAAGGPISQRVTIVSHTHWDRAWYVTFQEFRARLVRLVDRLLGLL